MKIIVNATKLSSAQYYVCAHLSLHALFWQPVPPAGTSPTSPHLLIRPNYINSTTKVDCIINLVRVLDL